MTYSGELKTRFFTNCFVTTLCGYSMLLAVGAYGIGEDKGLSPPTYEEIIVTSQKYKQRLLDVPISISILDNETIKKTGAQDINDLSYMVPSLSVRKTSGAFQTISIRGIGNVYGSSSLIGIYVDEIPASIFPGLSSDIQTLDLDLVEVLKGPQGTLYGQGSVGGTIRFITKNPLLNKFQGEVGSSIYQTQNGDSSEELTAILNLPIIDDSLAFRISSTYKDQGGWIDLPVSNNKNKNFNEISNIRIKGLWKITDKLTTTITAQNHKDKGGIMSVINFGDITDSNYYEVTDSNGSFLPIGLENNINLYNITLEYEFNNVTLTSSTSKMDTQFMTLSNVSHTGYSFAPDTLFSEYSLGLSASTEALTHETRFSAKFDKLDWVFGIYYTDAEKISLSEGYGAYTNNIFSYEVKSNSSVTDNSQTFSIFTNFSYHINDKTTLSIGTRQFNDDRKSSSSLISSSQEKSFNHLSSRVSLSYLLTPQTNIYANISEGFRSGGSNFITDIAYEPESVTSYELGIKNQLFDGRLQNEAAVYLSEYTNYQATSLDKETNFIIIKNPGEAEIKGIEWSTQLNLSELITLGFNGNITETKFTKVDPNISIVLKGDEISLIPKYSYSVNATFNFDWSSSISGFARFDYNRQGPSKDINRLTYARGANESEATGILNAHIGAQWQTVTLKLFGRNLNNELRAPAPSGFNTFPQNRPRSFGLDINYTF